MQSQGSQALQVPRLANLLREHSRCDQSDDGKDQRERKTASRNLMLLHPSSPMLSQFDSDEFFLRDSEGEGDS